MEYFDPDEANEHLLNVLDVLDDVDNYITEVSKLSKQIRNRTLAAEKALFADSPEPFLEAVAQLTESIDELTALEPADTYQALREVFDDVLSVAELVSEED